MTTTMTPRLEVLIDSYKSFRKTQKPLSAFNSVAEWMKHAQQNALVKHQILTGIEAECNKQK